MDFRPNQRLERIAGSRESTHASAENRLRYLKCYSSSDCLLVQAIHTLDQGEENLDSVMAITLTAVSWTPTTCCKPSTLNLSAPHPTALRHTSTF